MFGKNILLRAYREGGVEDERTDTRTIVFSATSKRNRNQKGSCERTERIKSSPCCFTE